MEPLLVFAVPEPSNRTWSNLDEALRSTGYPWRAVSCRTPAARFVPGVAWSGAIVVIGHDFEVAFALCRALRTDDPLAAPVLLLAAEDQLGDLALHDDLYDDLCLSPIDPGELKARLRRLLWRTRRVHRPELLECDSLVINLETHEAFVDGRLLDLTHREFELMRFFATHPREAFTREALLDGAWGTKYRFGPRSVDVHVRRVRAKLGQDHSDMISTIRSVGYCFGPRLQVGELPSQCSW